MFPSARALLTDADGKVLLLLRAKDAMVAPVTWCLPGGDIDQGELPLDAAIRELKEETELTVKIPVTPRSVKTEGTGWTCETFLFSGNVYCSSIDVVINTESDAYGWFEPASLPSSLFPGTKEVIQSLVLVEHQDVTNVPVSLSGGPIDANYSDEYKDGPGMSGDQDEINHDGLTTEERNKLPDMSFAFPRLRKMPLENASHVRNALARFNQVEGATEAEKVTARNKINGAAKKFGIEVSKKDSISVNRMDRGTLEPATFNEDGFMEANVYATRAGIFKYIDATGRIQRELRMPSEVFESKSLATLAKKPVTNDHPLVGLLDSRNAAKYAKGWTGQEVVRDGNLVKTSITIIDSDLINEIKNKKKMEVSCGYSCDLVFEPGEWQDEHYDAIQTNIRYNHLAVVAKGRAGSEVRLRLDASESITYDYTVEEKRVTKINLDGAELEVSEQVAVAFAAKARADAKDKKELEKQMDALAKQLKDSHNMFDALKKKVAAEEDDDDLVSNNSTREMDKAEKGGAGDNGVDVDSKNQDDDNLISNNGSSETMDKKKKNDTAALQAKVDSLTEELKARKDTSNIQNQVKARLQLEKSAAKFVPSENFDAMTDNEIKVAVIKSVQPGAVLEGKSASYIEARYDSALEIGAGRVDTIGRVYDAVNETRGSAGGDLVGEARKRHLEWSKNAHKQPVGKKAGN